jgi:hypothetical protein
VSDIDTVLVASLKALDPERPIREADICQCEGDVREVPVADIRDGPNRDFTGERPA